MIVDIAKTYMRFHAFGVHFLIYINFNTEKYPLL